MEVFRAVMAAGRMKNAADYLNVTQSAVSKAIRDLESELECSLFSRTRGGLTPTPEAIVLFKEVERAFTSLDQILDALKRIKLGERGRLRIAASPTLSSGFIQEVVGEFKEKYPEVELLVEFYNSQDIVELLSSGKFDMGYAMLPIEEDISKNFVIHTLPCVCLISSDHPLKFRKKISIEDAAEYPFISLSSNNPTQQRINLEFQKIGKAQKKHIQTNWSPAVANFVAQECGIAIVDPFTAKYANRMNCLVKPLSVQIDFTFGEFSQDLFAEARTAEIWKNIFHDRYIQIRAWVESLQA